MAKKVLFTVTPGQPLHKVFKTYIAQPPKGFEYVDISGQQPTFSRGRAGVSPLSPLWNLKRRFPFLIYHYKRWEERRVTRLIDKQNPDLIYCLNGRFYHGERPWVVDFENPSVFVSYNLKALHKYKKNIKEILMRDSCKGVIAYSQTGKRSLVEFFGKELEPKTFVIENAITLPKNTAKIKHKGFNLLFTGSANIDDNFSGRGGRVVIQAFLRLADRYPDMKLVMRCSVPENEKRLLEGKNVEIHEGVLSADAFEKLFRSADVYVFPSYYAFALTLLDAMSYGLPAIISDHLDNRELIDDGVNGLKVSPPKINYVIPHVPDFYFDADYNYKDDPKFVARIAEKIEQLYNDRRLLAKLSRGARKKVRQYTVEQKNRKLVALYRRALR